MITPKYNILVAEDSFALSNLLRFVLSNANLDAEIHHNGLDALQAARSRHFDAFLLDQQMPKMSGIEVLTSIRAEGHLTQTPAFLCTAKTHELEIERLRQELGITGVFHKPFSPKSLTHTLLETLNSAPTG